MLQTAVPNDLLRSYAEKELARLHQIRAVVDASKAGNSQVSIAREAGISQAEVHRILRRVADAPEMLERSPHEVILDWVVERIGHESMMDELLHWPYSFSEEAEPNNPLTVRTSGTWDQVTGAVYRGLLSDDDYDHLLESVRPPRK